MMGVIRDIAGQKFNRLTAICLNHKVPHQGHYWKCKCDCGKEVVRRKQDLTSGKSKSCGCLFRETRMGKFKHGMVGTPEYGSWSGIKGRCLNPNNPNYASYGGRGIKVCARWMKFQNFFKDMGKKPSADLSIERLNVNGDYSPENCIWADKKTQATNRRCTSKTHEILSTKIAQLESRVEQLEAENAAMRAHLVI